MNYQVNILNIKTIDQIEGAWTDADFIELLERLNFPDAKDAPKAELRDLLFMAITDFEPAEAAEIILTYTLSDKFSEGQIKQMSHDMLEDKLSEECPEISAQKRIFDVNELLYKAFNGQFPLAKASVVDFEMSTTNPMGKEITKERVLLAFGKGLSDRNIIKRLFEDQLEGKAPFLEAENILWSLDKKGEHEYQLITSEYWMNGDDFEETTFESAIQEYEESEEDQDED